MEREAWRLGSVLLCDFIPRYRVKKNKSNDNKEKTQIGDSTTSREHSLFSNCNHHDFVCSVHIGSAPYFRYLLVLKYGKINLMSSAWLYSLRHACMSIFRPFLGIS